MGAAECASALAAGERGHSDADPNLHTWGDIYTNPNGHPEWGNAHAHPHPHSAPVWGMRAGLGSKPDICGR